MVVKSIELVVEKINGSRTVEAGKALWEHPELPSRSLFFATVEICYEDIELPWFPSRVTAHVHIDDRMVSVQASEAVHEFDVVAQEVWVKIASAGSGFL